MEHDDPNAGDWDFDEDAAIAGEERLRELARAELAAAGPLTVADLAARLATHEDLAACGWSADDPIDEFLDDTLLAHDDQCWRAPDGRIGLVAALLAGRTFTHRVTEEELSLDVLVGTPDLVVVDLPDGTVRVRRDDGTPVGGDDDRIDTAFGVVSSTSDHRGGVITGPRDWVRGAAPDGLRPGDLVALTRRDDAVVVTRVDPTDALGTGAAEQAALRAAVDGRRRDGEGVEAFPVVLDALLADPACFATPVPPINELLAGAGLERRGVWLGPADEAWTFPGAATRDVLRSRVIAEWRMQPCCVEAYTAVDDAWNTVVLNTGWPADDARPAGADPLDAEAVAAALSHGSVSAAFADQRLLHHDAGSLELLRAFVDRLLTVDGPAGAGVHHLRGRILDAVDHDLPAAATAYEAALERDPTHDGAHLSLSEICTYRGDIPGAISHLRAFGATTADDELAVLTALVHPDPSIGRNDRCPCGSGRKYKQCCGRPMVVPRPLVAHALLVRVTRYASRDEHRDQIVSLAVAAVGGLARGPEDAVDTDATIDRVRPLLSNPFLVDLVLADGLLAEFAEVAGPLIDDDDRALLTAWIDTPLRRWDVTAVVSGRSLTLRDPGSGDEVTVTERNTARLAPGDHVLARIGEADGLHLFLGNPRTIPAHHLDTVDELVAADAPPLEWATWLASTLR